MTSGMPDLVIVDTSCLIALTRINHINILREVYNKLTVTPEVKAEFKFELPEWFDVRPVDNNADLTVINSIVDLGEASAIKLCMENKNSLLIIDDSKGRKLAKRLGLQITGTLGLLAKAKQKGIIESVKPYLDALEKVDFRFDKKLRIAVLKSIGE